MEVPVTTNITNNLLKEFEKGFIGCLNLTITLGVIWGGPLMLDMVCVTNLFDIFILEGSTIVSNVVGRDAIMKNDMVEVEFGYLGASVKSEWNFFPPFYEISCGTNDELVPIR